MKKLFFISFCLLLLSTTVFSQTIQELETKLKHTKDPDTLLKTYTDIGTKHYNDGNFTTALDYYLKVLDATKNTKSLLNTAIATHGAGSVYLETENYEKAETYLKEAQQLFSQLNDNRSLGRVLITLGNVYYMQMQDSLSEVYYLQAISTGHAANDSASLMDGYKNLGALYYEMEDRKDILKGLSFMEKSLNYINPADTLNHFQSYLTLAELYTYSGYLSEAKLWIDRCSRLLPHVKALHIIDDYYFCLHDYHKSKGDFEQALSNYKLYKIYQDSIFNTENAKQISELNVKYETEQKEHQIKLLNAQKDKQKLILISIILAVILFTVLATILFTRYKKQQKRKKEQEQKEQKEAERTRIARDMHDEIGAGLTRIVMWGEQAKLQSGKAVTNDITEALGKMSDESREISHNIGEIIWALNPKNDSLDNLFAYIRNYILDYLEDTNLGCKVLFPEDIPDVPISPELRRNLFLIVKESLNNIVKHSQATEVEIAMLLFSKHFSLTIKDNGKGIPQTDYQQGNGLENMRKRTEDMGGTFSVQSSEGGSGAVISVEQVPF